MATLYLLNYNNYYNRIVKQEADLSAYLDYAIPYQTSPEIILGIGGVNFNPNDGVDTEQIINWNNTIPDYLVVAENNDIRSRWFITEMARTRGGQYKLTLHRDVIVDNYINVLNAHIFIDKAKVPTSDIAIYNKEPYKFNSIKQSETILKDSTNCAWIVGYMSQKDPDSEGDYSLNGSVKAFASDDVVQYSFTHASDYFTSSVFTGMNYDPNVIIPEWRTFYGYGNPRFSIPVTYKPALLSSGNYIVARWIYSGDSSNMTSDETTTEESALRAYAAKEIANNEINGLTTAHIKLYNASKPQMQSRIDTISSLYTSFKNWNTEENVNTILNENGKLIKDITTGKYYVVTIEPVLKDSGLFDVITSTSAPSIFNKFKEVVENTSAPYLLSTISLELGSDQQFNVNYDAYYNYRVRLSEISIGLNYSLPSSSDRNHLNDSPYDMFCMPYENKTFYKNGVSLGTCNKFINLSAAMSIVSDLSGANIVYDIQLLPYCPIDSNYITANGDIDIKDMEVGKIKSGTDAELGWIVFCTKSTFSFSIENTINIDDIKSQHQLDNWRFNSPNWSGSYDFDVTLNKGLSYIDIDCTYKPFTPYIHVCPRFNSNGFYGYNNKDAVGLICGGDFSLPMVNDQWKTYEYQNKNYQNQFDRQIQNINTNYRFDNIERIASAGAGVASGAASGAVAGAAAGPVGAVGGAIVGGALSAAGGIGDLLLAQKKKEEAVSYATDQFNYQIDNIKSLPYTLSKVSALNGNNKLFPFIEHFSASEQEKEIFNNLIKWNGMTVNRVDSLSTFIDDDEKQYFSGRLIRIDIQEDFHMVAAIAQELSKGVFV